MGEDTEREVEESAAPEGAPAEDATSDEAKSPAGREQVPTHVPPHLREMFTKHEGSVAARPGFRNAANAKTKAQRKKRKKGKKRR